MFLNDKGNVFERKKLSYNFNFLKNKLKMDISSIDGMCLGVISRSMAQGIAEKLLPSHDKKNSRRYA